MADLACIRHDEALLDACRRLWDNLTTRRMYITSGIGSSFRNEGFTQDYDLPNVEAYCETCAAIGLVFWAHRMIHADVDPATNTPDGRYADVMERALYNNVASSVSLDGTRFLYWNKLHATNHDLQSKWHDHRQSWFDCACCPPNCARLLASLGQYVYSTGPGEVIVHLYATGEATAQLGDQTIRVQQQTMYPWDGDVRLTISVQRQTPWTLKLRIPGWCRTSRVVVNGKTVAGPTERGYWILHRLWNDGDVVQLQLDMPVQQIHAHPEVRADAGRIALQRGPIVYCLEQVDNAANLDAVTIPADAAFITTWRPELLGGIVTVQIQGYRASREAWERTLYRDGRRQTHSTQITAVPYCTWDNRTPGEMLVWVCQTPVTLVQPPNQ